MKAAYDYYRREAVKAKVPVPHTSMSRKRRGALVQCIVECGGLDGWCAYVDRLMKSDLCLGKLPPLPGKKQRFSLDFDRYVLDRDFLCHALEGKYDNRSNASNLISDDDPEVEVTVHKQNGSMVKEMSSLYSAPIDLWETRDGRLVMRHELDPWDMEAFQEVVG